MSDRHKPEACRKEMQGIFARAAAYEAKYAVPDMDNNPQVTRPHLECGMHKSNRGKFAGVFSMMCESVGHGAQAAHHHRPPSDKERLQAWKDGWVAPKEIPEGVYARRAPP